MAEGLNRVMLLGTLGQDPDLRTVGSGNAVLTIRMVTNERVKVRDECGGPPAYLLKADRL